MKVITTEIEADHAYLLPVGDIHLGSKSFGTQGRKKLKGYLDWALERQENARIFLMGDLFDVATRQSKTSPYESDPGEYMEALEIFKPYAHITVGAIDGNHEARLLDFAGISPLQHFCHALGIDYCQWSALLKIRVGKRAPRAGRNSADYNVTYHAYMHHTTGGGKYIGAGLKRVEDLDRLCAGADLYCGGHNHQLAVGMREVYTVTGKQQRVTYVDCGSYLEWNGSYAERGQYAPSKLGSPRIRLASGADGRKDVHVSL